MSEPKALGDVIAKLRKLATLQADDEAAVNDLPFEVRNVRAGAHLVREGEVAEHCCALIKGFAFRYKLAGGGHRQILSFHMPGDLLDLQRLLLARADHSVVTMTDAEVAYIPLRDLKALADTRPVIAEALWRDTLIDAAIFREWVLNVGQRDAKTRIAHMLCEFALRRSIAGLGTPERNPIPMTQQQVADATGMTPIHVNRMLAVLAQEGLLAKYGRRMEIANWSGLQRVAGFDPSYLHAMQ